MDHDVQVLRSTASDFTWPNGTVTRCGGTQMMTRVKPAITAIGGRGKVETGIGDVRTELTALLDRAVRMTDERLATMPAYEALREIRTQLLQVQQDVARGGAPDQSLQQRIIFARFAVRELEDVDPEYADVLTRAAHLYRRRLEVPHDA